MHHMNPKYDPLPEICTTLEAPKNFFLQLLNASFIIYTYIYTLYINIFTCINTLKVLNMKLKGSLSDKCTFTFFFTFKIPTDF